MRKFLLIALAICSFGLATNADADVTCRNSKKYTSCASGYYMTYGGTYNGTPRNGNACTACPSNCECSGGLNDKECQTTATITFKTGNTTLGTQTCTIGQSVTLNTLSSMNSNVPSGLKTNGWNFDGWARTASEDVEYDNGESITCPSSDLTLYGVWSRSVTFKYYNSASATTVTSSTKSQLYFNHSTSAGSVTTMGTYALYTQSTYGWAPLGWRYDDDGSGAVVSQTGTSTMIVAPAMTDPATVYAVYERTPQIKYNANGGSGSMSNSNCDEQRYLAGYGEIYSAECRLNGNQFTPPSGSTFSGYWAKGSTSGTQVEAGDDFYFPNNTWTGATTYDVYAIWVTTNVAVSFNLNQGSGTAPASTTCTPGTSCTVITTANRTGDTTSFYRCGHVFLGWYSGGSKLTSNSITTTTSITYTAEWDECLRGYYKPGSGTKANAACIAASDGYYVDDDGMCSQDQCPSGWRDGSDDGRNEIEDCYKNCTKTCSGNDTSSCPDHATCTYNTSATSSGIEHYNKNDCNASTILCPVDTITCDTGYHKSGSSCVANTCSVIFKTGNSQMGTQSGFTYGTGKKLTAVSSLSNIPVSGNSWSFYGWATTTGTTTRTYTDNQSVSNICTTDGGTVTLYGIWQRTVTIKYYNSSGVLQTNTNRTQSYYNTTSTGGGVNGVTSFALYSNSTYGWAPLGWRYDTTASGTVSVSQTGTSTKTVTPPATGAAVVNAVYSRTPEVAYNANGGTGTMSNSTCGTQYYNAGGTGSSSSCTLSSNGFTAPSNKQFNKWAAGSASGTQYAAGASYSCPNTTYDSSKTCNTMYAIWENATVTVSFNLNSGSGTAPSSVNCTIGASCTVINDDNRTGNVTTFYRAGYVFAGWFDTSAATGGNQLTSNSITTSVAKTYYARWTACANAYYKPGSGTKANASCTACTTASGWTTATASTASTAYTACYQTQTPANCASGTIKRTASSISGTTITYGSATVTSALSSNAGYYVNDTACTICANGTFYGGGTATACTACPTLDSGYAYVSGTGWTAYSSCKEQMRPTN
ncbi:MAG: InlB B-repeat-containing protein, partial [Alphaproteobacteria bacterium]|nr:InlB B-repeat-containing protein [Alphaproteobacteria bacterium]